MNVTKARITLEAFAAFIPALPGLLKEQAIGPGPISIDLGEIDLLNVVKLSVTNFGTSGTGTTINADTLITTTATGTTSIEDNSGLDADKQTIAVGDHRLVLLYVRDGPENLAVSLDATDFKLRASKGMFSCAVCDAAALIAGSGTWTLHGPTGAQDPQWIIEIYAFSSAG